MAGNMHPLPPPDAAPDDLPRGRVLRPRSRTPDVLVVGGGPAGSATATILAQAGRKVLLLERERFPRFRIGESLMPATWWTLERLGVLDKLRGTAFPRKHSVQFFSQDGRAGRPFYFSDVDPHESSVTWQVDRGRFDSILLEHAAEAGAEVVQGAAVHEVLFDGERAAGARAEIPGHGTVTIECPVVVDATGQSALLARELKLQQWDPLLRNSSLFTRYRGAGRDSGIDAGATLIFHTEERRSWFWYIPLPDDVASVGVVGPLDYLVRGRDGDPARVYAEELDRCPALRARLEGAKQLHEVRALKDFSYISRRIAGPGWVLVGDAFGFLDPIYSSGVFLALKGAELAADSIDEAFRASDFSAERLGRHGDGFVAGMEAVRRLVYAFYDDGFSFARFLEKHPARREDLVHLLIGNVFRHPTEGLQEALEMELGDPSYRPLRLAGAS